MKTSSTVPLDKKGPVLLFFTRDHGEPPFSLAVASVMMVAEIKEEKSSLRTQKWRRCAGSYKKVQK
jgi:hypothetical protein